MIENIMETTVMGSNIVFLNIPEEDYFLSYDSVTREAAQEITSNYFLMRAREGVPKVKDIQFDEPSHRVKITLEVDLEDNNYSGLKGYKVPDSLNITRNNEKQ
ncbi:hypothetical protein JK636_05390 [Clostridium sp. YIM B02515]|jgi:hypothetical protein|uniref:Uncharacterized protein n=1 Tax=Clostridium rhizosphaerae TaxID=2803861 RepID=A0ABS1T768_9CLOT|nr:hypothetical protein [Clostridium rhizosphaerae]ERI90257.1 hypothetical protein HMPREF1982_04010 [Clostridiales bacterium oral taxon 876 str. F0540]MBL4935188.1 hypothetical protein [Clostridium rhizosphaerae]